MAPAPPVKVPSHQRIVFRKMIPTWDYIPYWIKKPIFTPGKWKIRFYLPSWRGTSLYTNEIEINVTFKTGRAQDKEAFEYMFGGKKKHSWYTITYQGQKPITDARYRKELAQFIDQFPWSRFSRYARLKYVVATQTITDPETVRRRKEYIKYLRRTHSRTNPLFPPWLAKYYLPADAPRPTEPPAD
ncbi:MAG: hypothetical protein GXP31_15975 [Kiritimatiellaeota bacterium]|nr:hypothetical protein [Kiritimatiellota bacterium]